MAAFSGVSPAEGPEMFLAVGVISALVTLPPRRMASTVERMDSLHNKSLNRASAQSLGGAGLRLVIQWLKTIIKAHVTSHLCPIPLLLWDDVLPAGCDMAPLPRGHCPTEEEEQFPSMPHFSGVPRSFPEAP